MTATTPDTRTGTGQQLYRRARALMPGGVQLLSKRPELFLPEQWPAYFSRCQGAHVWDLDGNRYLDGTHFGVGAPILGYCDPDVNEAVMNALRMGVSSTLNCPEEVELAELMIDLHPWAEMVRFARGGGEIMAVAVRIARAATGRDKVAVCGYHGWQDWYLAANLSEEKALDGHLLPGLAPAGVPRGLTGSILTFQYNALEQFRAIIRDHGHELAAIVMEPARSAGPEPGFLETIREEASKAGIVLIFDEITSGWRMLTGGIHMLYGVAPDLACFAKGMGNGHAISSVIGRRSVMDAAQGSFISSTNWTERVGPTAALATIRKHRRLNVASHLIATGETIRAGWKAAAAEAGIGVSITGIPPLSYLGFQHPEPLALTTYFTQEMLRRGVLAGGAFYASLAHSEAEVNEYLDGVAAVFPMVADAVRQGDVMSRLEGPVRHAGFHRLS